MTLSRPPAPFSPLVAGGDGLERYPQAHAALCQRMAEIYGVAISQVLPIRGVTHGLELVFRLAARNGSQVDAPAGQPFQHLATLYRPGADDAPLAAVIRQANDGPEGLRDIASQIAPALLIVDEGLAEFDDAPSAATLVHQVANVVVLRSLSLAYGLAGARVGAAIGSPESLAELASVMEPYALPEPSARLALQALHPSRMAETEQRIGLVRQERQRLAEALALKCEVEPGIGPELRVRPTDPVAALAACARLGVESRRDGDDLQVPVSFSREANDRVLLAFGLPTPAGSAHRTGQSVRDTLETRIVCAVDLDASAPVAIQTGVGFFDHMLEQVAAHGGFSVRLSCSGDLHTDPHHTVEDSAIALGQALWQALGDRKGIARYGFVLPMDDAEAKVSIDLSGRPYAVFEGQFATPMLGDYRTDLTAHVFRSLAEHLRAAIHVSVTGDDDHHKTEACFKALGRALRQAIRIEGQAVPSTKGVL